MRWLGILLLCACGGEAKPPTPEEITDRAWAAHAAVIAAGERVLMQGQPCAAAGAAMQATFAEHRQAFVDSVALDRDKAKLAQATAFIEANDARYRDLATRMEALSDRCAEDPTVQAAFDQMASP